AEAEGEEYLTHLAVERDVSASTQHQALCALVFLYRQVLDRPLGRINAVRSKRPERLPVVLSPAEVRRLLDEVQGADGLYRLRACLLYGSGLRLFECCQIRYHDLDLGRRQILVPAGQGANDRVVL